MTSEVQIQPSDVAEADWERAVALLRRHETVALACHVTPDGDALGSMLACGLALRQAGKRVVASFGDQAFQVPRLLRFLPGQELLVPPAEFPAGPPLMITFDASTVDRLGLLIPAAREAGELVVVDHHASNTGFGSVHLVNPVAAATAVLVEELIERLGLVVTKDIATCLYTGLVTDTGSFRYPATTPAVHAMAGRLLATGLDPDAIARELWDRSPFGYLRVLGVALSRAAFEPDAAGGAGLVWTRVTRQDRAQCGLPYDEVEGMIDVIRKVDGADVAVVLKEDDAGAWNVSTRSKGRVDVGRACAALGGGGHRGAAGFTSADSPEQTMARLRELLS
ncbi:DHH family phosphoesterase [Acrocarpospora catenulata]|uniref:DHH family phosphoesterase n=1 Tax=Acrocarpospora catenulata TaxID=2836182 RepID=UPI001BDB5630|nr:bifunctional oligoribonuclease/PAP phosphatase NrnA [Acrocarpospora catenulata]